jgi:hypothetical protein
VTRDFNWVPGIGDPTIGGWVTVLLYLLACVSCWKTAGVVVRRDWSGQSDSHVWRAISIAFFLLGIIKQLDLQSAMTELGRIVAFAGGWYEQRGTGKFILSLALPRRGRHYDYALLDQKIPNSNLASARRFNICAGVRTNPSSFFSSY